MNNIKNYEFRKYFRLVNYIFLLVLVLMNISTIVATLSRIIKIFRPVLIAVVMAFIVNIPMSIIEEFLKKNIDQLGDMKIIVFCDGASPYEEKAFEEIKKHNMKGKLQNIPFYYCRGAWDMESMNLVDRNLCKMLRKAVAKKDPADYEVWETALMAAGENKCDWTDKSYLKPIIEEIILDVERK